MPRARLTTQAGLSRRAHSLHMDTDVRNGSAWAHYYKKPFALPFGLPFHPCLPGWLCNRVAAPLLHATACIPYSYIREVSAAGAVRSLVQNRTLFGGPVGVQSKRLIV